jgi:hypothetical protein
LITGKSAGPCDRVDAAPLRQRPSTNAPSGRFRSPAVPPSDDRRGACWPRRRREHVRDRDPARGRVDALRASASWQRFAGRELPRQRMDLLSLPSASAS